MNEVMPKDVENAREMVWFNAVIGGLNGGKGAKFAIAEADEILKAYDERRTTGYKIFFGS